MRPSPRPRPGAARSWLLLALLVHKRHFKLAVIAEMASLREASELYKNATVEDNVDPVVEDNVYYSEAEKGMASVAAPQAQASSTSTSTSSTGEPVLDTLMQQLAPEARQTYWQALARFLRFETSKAEFEESVAAALGDKRALHNALIYALLRGALAAPGSGGGHLSQIAATPSGDPAAPPPELPSLSALEPAPGASGAPAAGPSQATAGGGVGAGGGGGGGAMKLSLKIKMGSDGNFAAVSDVPQATVDPEEEAQLNALHERLSETAKQQGVARVAPEAASFMQIAVTAHVHRMLAARAYNGAVPNGAFATWMWPPSQRTPVGAPDFSMYDAPPP